MATTAKNLISLRDVLVQFGPSVILSKVTFSVGNGDKLALVGPNGAGKSTILKLLTGRMTPDGGKIEFAKDISIGYLPQITADDERIEHEAETLSGGQKTKRLLGELFAGQHDLYLLDEPTNNLDAEGKKWLLHEIQKGSVSEAAFMIVSHDREFLDNVTTATLEIDAERHSLKRYDCIFSEYRNIKQKEADLAWKKYDEEKLETKRLDRSVKERIGWMEKIEQKRKNNRKLDPGEKEKPRAAVLRDKEGTMGKRARIIKDRLLDQVAETEAAKPNIVRAIDLHFENVARSGDLVFSIKEASMYGIAPITLDIHYGERIHLSGKNGSGKTTLLKMLLGEISTKGESGEMKGEIKVGTGVQIAYLAQEEVFRKYHDENLIDSVFDILGLVKNDEEQGRVRKTLKRFGFGDEDMKKKVGIMSSGEQSRLRLALMQLMHPNCIILDEPTNHLDIECLEALETALKEFPGTLIVASHDTVFVEKIGLGKEVKLGA